METPPNDKLKEAAETYKNIKVKDMEEIKLDERETFVCECHSLEHQVSFWYDDEDKILRCEPHLSTSNGFFKRLLLGLKYAFGYKSTYGAWDDMVFQEKDKQRLKEFINKRF